MSSRKLPLVAALLPLSSFLFHVGCSETAQPPAESAEAVASAPTPTQAQEPDEPGEVQAMVPSEGQGPPPLPDGVEFQDGDSGLRYAVIHRGGGASPHAGQVVEIHYTSWLADSGYRFDSTVDKGRPLRVTLGEGQLPVGLELAVSSMTVAEKRRVLVPPALSSYPDGSPAAQGLPEGAALMYDVELLAIGAGDVNPAQ